MSTATTMDASRPESEKPDRPIRPRRRWDTEFSAAIASAVLAMGAFCLSLFARDTYPFGATSRAVNDLGNQFIHFHAELWDLQHGEASGDVFLSWSSHPRNRSSRNHPPNTQWPCPRRDAAVRAVLPGSVR